MKMIFLTVLLFIVQSSALEVKIKDDGSIIRIVPGDSIRFEKELSDGKYILVDEEDTNLIKRRFSVKNGKLNGLETRYITFKTKTKACEINWLNGSKNGKEIHYDEDGRINLLLTYKNDTLNGPVFVSYYPGGRPMFKGFYKMGLRDSIWTIYDDLIEGRWDSLNYYISEKIHFKDAIPYLISAWDKSGNEVVKDGKGSIRIDRGWNTVYYYEDGLLKKEMSYFDNGKLESVWEWAHPEKIEIDTSTMIHNNYVGDILNRQFNTHYYTTQLLEDGKWELYYQNEKIAYTGSYEKGEPINEWFWFFRNGEKRMEADYLKSKLHSYISGKSFRLGKIERFYLSLVTAHYFSCVHDTVQSELNSLVPITDDRFSSGLCRDGIELGQLLAIIDFKEIKRIKSKKPKYRIKFSVLDERIRELLPGANIIVASYDKRREIGSWRVVHTTSLEEDQTMTVLLNKDDIMAIDMMGYYSLVYFIGGFLHFEFAD
jgi:antitoxin component YwqK of YwqJK toxin-antitoxin module